jgi:hypothetical protein
MSQNNVGGSSENEEDIKIDDVSEIDTLIFNSNNSKPNTGHNSSDSFNLGDSPSFNLDLGSSESNASSLLIIPYSILNAPKLSFKKHK